MDSTIYASHVYNTFQATSGNSGLEFTSLNNSTLLVRMVRIASPSMVRIVVSRHPFNDIRTYISENTVRPIHAYVCANTLPCQIVRIEARWFVYHIVSS